MIRPRTPGDQKKAAENQFLDKNRAINQYKRLLQQLHEMEGEEYDAQKLFMKQLHMRQLMGLKTKGRYLEETKIFDNEMKTLPSADSQ